MYIARCVFEQNYGYSKTYDYKINQTQRMTLRVGDNVVVTRARGGYSVAIIDSIDVIDPDIAQHVTQHVCCVVNDEFYTEDEGDE